jgi:hypothetical protein
MKYKKKTSRENSSENSGKQINFNLFNWVFF